ncbi:AAA family ATPase [Sporosarcina sp. Te-1]|uniref:AAA family ATPase n=1 Tax=Sporosarcina sp. Te-1 TaxID=2818390 RepID=UPI001A9F5B13|nr:AAA family ATPase [Sporosarcina sp. Te-1]QTD43386.1 AAA family ATPase [Sporosarcina sp. Te-1]
MAGFPGSGKSTLARQIARKNGAVIVDHDIVKSSLMNSFEGESMDGKQAGSIAYAIDWSLIDFHLSQGQDVIFDSPCLYDEIIEKGIYLTKKHQTVYKFIECQLQDFTEVNRRLRSRERMVSQIAQAESEEAYYRTIRESKRPLGIHLIVDTSRPVDSYFDQVMKYLLD